MAKIKTTYFDLPAMGEPIRLLLAYGGEEFEDNRITAQKWMEFKRTTPFGQLPIYEENGKVMNQTLAILRYLGKKYKLNGADSWENLEIDAMADTILDFIIKIALCHYEQSASAKSKKEEVLCNETIPFYLERLEQIAKTNNGHLAAKKLTWVDFLFAATVKYMSMMAKFDLIEKNPSLKAVHENIMNLPAVKSWYKKHPVPLDNTRAWLESTGKPTKE